MTVRLPASLVAAGADGNPLLALEHEMLAEKAASLGRAGEQAAHALARLKAHSGDEAARARLLRAAAVAVHQWFIQRELCGLRRHDEVIRELAIPRAVLARLGAS